ncbi:MAG: FAD-dependent oxidoreductase, partial [Oscillospiraceae bacterium]
MYDVIVIGGGICGASVLFELSKLKIKAALVEKESDISMGTTKANSAIVHAGYDPMPGTLMAKYNVKGSKLINKLCEDLNVPYKQIGSLVLAFNDDEMEEVKTLYNRGKENGVDGLKIISEQEVIQLEPNINPVKGALLAETAAIVSPWSLAIALCETAVINGAKVFCNNEIEQIDFQNEIYTLKTNNNEFKTKYIINCAGLFADKIQEMAAKSKSYFQIKPDKGCYYLLDKSQGDIVKHIVFQCPTKVGKGVLVSPTTHGNLIVGPDSQRIVSNCDLSTKRENLEFVKLMAAKTTSKINYRENIRNFAGLRAYSNFNDFIVEKSPQNQNFINVAGIKSPGLSS